MKTLEEKQCHLRCWEMHQRGHHAREPRSSWADVLSEDTEDREHCAVVIHHYGYLPARSVWFMHFVPVGSFGSGNCWHGILPTTMRTHFAQNVNEQLHIVCLSWGWDFPESVWVVLRKQGTRQWYAILYDNIFMPLCHSKTSVESPHCPLCHVPWDRHIVNKPWDTTSLMDYYISAFNF